MIQNNCKLIGLTGGIGTGKSTVSQFLMEKGYPIIDADKIAREVVELNKPAYREIIREFGDDILQKDKNIDRKALGNIIFNNKELREKLNSIIHPYILKSIKDEINKLKEEPIIILDIPLLFELYSLWKVYNIHFHEIWLVYLNKDIQIERLAKRDNISKEEAIKKIESQMNLEEKRTKSSKILDNSGDIENLKKQVEDLLNSLI